jgi:hypothetical protein
MVSALSRSAFPWPITLGSEFEFTSRELIEKGAANSAGMGKNSLEAKVAAQYFEAVVKRCPDCKTEIVVGKWGLERKIYLDDWWFQISTDPSCIEILTKPSTLGELRALAPKINHVLFGAALEDLQLFADHETGAGHVNFGAISAFGSDDVLFFKYFTDFSNHPELAFGALGWDNANAPAIAVLQPKQKDAFVKLLADVRDGKVSSVAEGARRIQTEIYTWTPEDLPQNAYHYQAVGLKKLNKASFPATDAPFEIRAMFPQASEDDFILIGEMIERRIQFLKNQPGQLTYLNIPIPEDGLGYQRIVDVYYKYITEMGLDWDRYRNLMYHDMKDVEPGDFVRGHITWDAEYAQSLIEFVPYLQTSKWVREKIFRAFTHSHDAEKTVVRKTLSKLIDSIDPEAVYAHIAFDVVEQILNSSSWAHRPERTLLLKLLDHRIHQKTGQICEEALSAK